MVLNRNSDIGETMPQTVPSAGFTPPCDYTNFAENFDLSLLPSSCDDDQLSYQQQSYQIKPNPKIFTTYYPTTSQPDFQILLENDSKDKNPSSGIYLQLPITNSDKQQQQQQQQQLSPNSTSTDYGTYRQSYETNFYPSSPELSLYTPSPNSIYSRSPCDDFPIINATMNNNNNQKQFGIKIKEENFLSPCNFSAPASPATSYSNHSSPGQHYPGDVIDLLENTVLDKDIKQESTVDFGSILDGFHYSTESTNNNNTMLLTKKGNDKPKDHQLLREALRDTSFQKKFNIKPIDLCIINNDDNVGDIKMEDTTNDDHHNHDNRTNHDNDNQNDIMRDNIEPVLNLAIEQLRKDVDSTCVALGISPDPIQWSQANVLSWLQWTSRQFGLNEPNPDEWNINGTNLLELTENDFIKKSPQGGMILYAQLEIWKAAFSNEEFNPNWMPDTASSNASSGDISDDDDEESTPSHSDLIKPTVSHTNRIGGNSGTNSGSSHIHLWQFLKELLSTPQTHGSCIRWMDRTKGIFKIEDSVKVARLWGKRKNRPAMNYDKLSRSIRQYYKKGIMKKTERSQRLVYQFCHPYNL